MSTSTTPPGSRISRRFLLILGAIILVAGGATTALVLLLHKPGEPSNDRFTSAATIGGSTFSGTSVNAVADPDAVAAGVQHTGDHAVWFRWTAARGGWAYVTPARADAVAPPVRAYLGAGVTGLVRADVVADGAPAGAAIPAIAGRTYTLLVGGPAAGSFDLAITQPANGGPPNDDLGAAAGVGGTVEKASATGKAQTVATDTLAQATAESGETRGAHSVWFTWQSAGTGTVSFSAASAYGSTGPFRVSIYTVTPPTGTAVVSTSSLTPVGKAGSFTAARGTVYAIAVDGPEEFYTLTVTASGIGSSLDTTPPVVNCGAAPTTWTNGAAAQVTCTAADAGTGLADPADASFPLTAATVDGVEDANLTTGTRSICDRSGNCTAVGPVAGLRADRKAPAVSCPPAPVTWQSAVPQVICTAVDGGSGLASPLDATRTFSTTATPAQTEVLIPGGSICDKAGNCTQVAPFGPVRVDAQAPVVTCDKLPAGPQLTEVSVTCTAVDGGSGLAVTANAQFTLHTSVGAGNNDASARTDARQVCDLAGNCAAAGPLGPIEVDLAPPSVLCAPTDGSALDRWRSGPLTLTCDVTDTGAGLTAGTPRKITLLATVPNGQESADVSAKATTGGQTSGGARVCDKVGVCAAVGPVPGIKIDRKAPVVTCPTSTGGWVATTASVSCSVVDGGSGLTGPASVTLTAKQRAGAAGPVGTGTGKVCDAVGNCATAGPVTGLLVDSAPPAVTCAKPAPLYHVEAQINCKATDVGSGLITSDDASFALVSSVGDGNDAPAAATDSRQVCDAAGLCTTVGPLTVNVDLRAEPGAGPAIKVPRQVTVLVADDATTSAPPAVQYDLPLAPGADSVECRSRPGSAFAYGWTTVVCQAVAPLGVSYASFPIVVKSVPELAGTGTVTAGAPWRAVGIGFAPGSTVRIDLDGAQLATEKADAAGRLSESVLTPAALAPGAHQLVLRGMDPESNPLLVISPLPAAAAVAGQAVPTQIPSAAPSLPAAAVAVPADPGPAPAAPVLTGGASDDPGSPAPAGSTGGSAGPSVSGGGSGQNGSGGQNGSRGQNSSGGQGWGRTDPDREVTGR